MGSVRSWFARVVLSVAVLLPVTVALAPGAQASTAAYTKLHLINGWTQSPFGTRKAQVILKKGIVVFRGAIANGSNPVAFVLPSSFRPSTNVFVPVDMCAATNGRLLIQPDGTTTVQAEGSFSNAQCFTSLDGASFAKTASGYTPLGLQNGWTNAPFGTRAAAARVISGVVHLQGAIAGGTSTGVFTLPTAFRPSARTFVPVDLCNAANGRLIVETNGDTQVQAENAFSDAQCFTSLDGVSFAKTASGFTALTLQNGWTDTSFGTRHAALRVVAGVVHFEGAMESGASGFAFTLPAAAIPSKAVYVQVDLCNATNGRLDIATNGDVSVEAEGGVFSNAQCFTSLEGTTFATG